MIFVDTGFLVAIVDGGDRLHAASRRLATELQGRPLVTTDAVFSEFLAAFCGRGPHLRRTAVQILAGLRKRAGVEVVQASAWFDRGLELFERRPDKGYSHVDCVSFCVMRERGIRESLAHDEHFEQEGFAALLRREAG